MSPVNKFSPLWAEIDLGVLRKNLRVLRASLENPSTQVLAIVKADAYGHGMIRISKSLWNGGVRFFGVANISEALLLRQALPSARILVLGVFHPSQLSEYIAKKITPTISSTEDILSLNRALKGKSAFPVHVKIDTGMGRLGLPPEAIEDFFRRIKPFSTIDVEGVYTHFSSADEASEIPTRTQLQIFSENLKKIRSLGFSPRLIHACNSMGVLRFKEAHFNLVRPGLVLYGLKPAFSAKLPPGIRPVLSWKARISFLKKFSAGQTVSYGRTHRIGRNTLIALLPVGYSHGYRVAFSNKSFVLIRGQRCPVVGRVTMDQTLVDVGKVGGVRRWEEAVLAGTQGKESVSVEDLAGWASTIPYEIVCGIHSRVPRKYVVSP